MKSEILLEIDELIELAKQTKNSYMRIKLSKIKRKLLEEWNNSDFYYEQLKKDLQNVDISGTCN